MSGSIAFIISLKLAVCFRNLRTATLDRARSSTDPSNRNSVAMATAASNASTFSISMAVSNSLRADLRKALSRAPSMRASARARRNTFVRPTTMASRSNDSEDANASTKHTAPSLFGECVMSQSFPNLLQKRFIGVPSRVASSASTTCRRPIYLNCSKTSAPRQDAGAWSALGLTHRTNCGLVLSTVRVNSRGTCRRPWRRTLVVYSLV